MVRSHPHVSSPPDSPHRGLFVLLAQFLAIVALVETLTHLLVGSRPGLGWGGAVLDAFLMALLSAPFVLLRLHRERTRRREAEESLRRNYESQLLLNDLLEFSLRRVPLEEVLEHFLDLLLGLPWMHLTPKAGIFLTEEDGRTLRLVAHRGLEPVLAQCARVPFGRCLCGRAAQEGKTLFSAHLDDAHETRYEGITDHGHYCVPIRSEGRTHGLLVLYVPAGHFSKEEERLFLDAMGGLLAGVLERLRARASVEESARRLEALISNALDLITVLDEKGTATFASPSIRSILGYAPEEYVGLDAFSLIHADDRESVLAAFGRVLSRPGTTQTAEFRYRRKDGSWAHLQSLGKVFEAPEGRRVIINSRDVSDRRLAAQELALLATAIEQSGESVVITDPKGVIEYVNPAFLAVSGYSREEVLGRAASMLKSGRHDADFYRALWGTIAEGGVWRGRFINRRKDGALYEDESVISPVRDSEGRIIHYVSVRRDVTERLRMEEQLRQSQKMESLGLLAGGVAHDFNNMLTLIMGYNEYLREGLGEGHPLQRFASSVRKAADGAAAMTRQLLAFSRRQVLAPRVFDLNAAVSDTGRMLRRLVGEHISFDIRLHPQLCPVKADPGQLDQVVLNLVVNARDAMPEGGSLVVSTSERVLDRQTLPNPVAGLPAGRYVVLAVEDNGQGMDEATRARIFEPFFTTKPPGKGTGLGLSTVYGIVRQNGGHIEVESAPGKGTAFRVYLPRTEEPVTLAAARPSDGTKVGGETVLLVEDNHDLRELVEKTLRDSGYRVLSASDAESALEAARRHPGGINLLVTDVLLPGMSGVELARRLPGVSPSTKALFISGFANTGVQETLPMGARLLDKPFTGEELLSGVRQALDS